MLIIVVLYLILCVLAIMAYGTYRCRTDGFEDPLTQSVVDREPWNRYIDGWGILHFWFFAMLAYNFPSHWCLILLAGVLWEYIEMQFKEKPFYLAKCNVASAEKKNWWYGRWEDLVMNSLGMLFGLWLRARNVTALFFPTALVGIISSHYVLLKIRTREASGEAT